LAVVVHKSENVEIAFLKEFFRLCKKHMIMSY